MLSYATHNDFVMRLSELHDATNGTGTAKAIPWATIIEEIMKLLSGGGCLPTPAKSSDLQAAIAGDAHGYIEGGVRRGLRRDYGIRKAIALTPSVMATFKAYVAKPEDDPFLARVQAASDTDD